MLIICGFHVCEFAYSLKFVYNPKSMLVMLLWSFRDMSRWTKYCSHPMCTFPVEVKQASTLPSSIRSHTVNSVLFTAYVVLRWYFFPSHFCAFSWWFCCLKWPPSIVLECCPVFLRKKSVTSLSKNICVR